MTTIDEIRPERIPNSAMEEMADWGPQTPYYSTYGFDIKDQR
jgi:hypothetical protein